MSKQQQNCSRNFLRETGKLWGTGLHLADDWSPGAFLRAQSCAMLFVSDLDAGVERSISKFAGRCCGLSGGTRGLHGDLDTLEHRAVINSMKLKSKCWILSLGGSNARHKYKRMAGEQPCRMGPGDAGQQQLSRSQHWAQAPRGQTPSWGHQTQHGRSARRGAYAAVLSDAAASPRALRTVLGLSISERCEGP